ncbi:MAG: hypothetical protein WC357_08650 [Candidatus Omnitrophota bacterium]
MKKILLFLSLSMFMNFSLCYAERVKSYLRSDGASVTWYKRCNSNGEVREDYSYDIRR